MSSVKLQIREFIVSTWLNGDDRGLKDDTDLQESGLSDSHHARAHQFSGKHFRDSGRSGRHSCRNVPNLPDTIAALVDQKKKSNLRSRVERTA